MIINYLGGNPTFFSDAFLDAGGYNVSVASATSTEIVLLQASTGQRTTITGTGLVFDGNGALVEAGTITGMAFQDSVLTTLATFSGMRWDMAVLHQALLDEAAGNSTGLNALFVGQANELNLSGIIAPSTFVYAGMDPYLLNNLTTLPGGTIQSAIHHTGRNRGVITTERDGGTHIQTGSGIDTLKGASRHSGADDFTGGTKAEMFYGYYVFVEGDLLTDYKRPGTVRLVDMGPA
ncbi:MAG: hypothetical protein GXP03_06565 [Alphaproteobacteria bacterium]|nr:hypothetical protein [Alphaproteobacteria bacterium]